MKIYILLLIIPFALTVSIPALFQGISATSDNIKLLENPYSDITPSKYDDDDDSLFRGLLAPEQPCSLVMNKLESFVFRTLLTDASSENIRIYLAQGERSEDAADKKEHFKTLRELGRLSIPSGLHDWMMLWAPKVTDGIRVEGGNDYFLVFKRTSWWGWKKEIVYESQHMKIIPSGDRKKGQFKLQI